MEFLERLSEVDEETSAVMKAATELSGDTDLLRESSTGMALTGVAHGQEQGLESSPAHPVQGAMMRAGQRVAGLAVSVPINAADLGNPNPDHTVAHC